MKLKDIFIEQKLGTDKIYVSRDDEIFNGLMSANSTAEFILNCLHEDTSVEKIISKITDEYEISREDARKYISDIIHQLSELNLLE